MEYKSPELYTLQSSDNQLIKISHGAATFIDSFQVIIADAKIFHEKKPMEYPIPVKGSILQIIVDFCEMRHKIFNAKDKKDLDKIHDFKLPEDQIEEIAIMAVFLQVQGF